jgi:Mpv17 / PMP22 family
VADFWPTYLAEAAFWPGFQALNFLAVPVQHQLLAVNVACLADSTFLCWCVAANPWLLSPRCGMFEVCVHQATAVYPRT